MQERLNQIFEQKDLTAAKFAALIGVSASTISHILAGRNKPGFDIINSIAKVFPDISLSWLITGEGSMYNHVSYAKQEKEKLKEPTLFDSEFKSENSPSEEISDRKVEKFAPANTTHSEIPFIPSAISKNEKRIKRIVLFFDDGSFEDYQK